MVNTLLSLELGVSFIVLFYYYFTEIVATVPNDNKRLTAKLWHSDTNLPARAAYLMNGCHILVTTPTTLLKVTKRKWTHLNRTSHLVFHQAQLTFETHEEEVGKIMSHFKMIHSQKRKEILFSNQVVVMASSWTTAVHQFFDKFMRDENQVGPVIAMDNFLEAAIYGNVDTRVQFLRTRKDKLIALETLLESKIKGSAGASNFVMVLCKDANSAQDIHKFLRDKSGIDTDIVSEDMEGLEISRRIDKFHAREGAEVNPRPLILSDRALMFLNTPIHSCKEIVHFDLPDHSKAAFAERYQPPQTSLENGIRQFLLF